MKVSINWKVYSHTENGYSFRDSPTTEMDFKLPRNFRRNRLLKLFRLFGLMPKLGNKTKRMIRRLRSVSQPILNQQQSPTADAGKKE